MSKREKLLLRLKARPTDFTGSELVAVMTSFGYEVRATGGSGRKFIHPATGSTLYMHQPHPSNVLKAYQVREALEELKERGYL